MKEWALKLFKFVGASIGVLMAAYTLGWSGATTLHYLFKTEKTEAQTFVKESIVESESKIMGIHNADVTGLREGILIISRQNQTMIQQNTEILRRLPRE